MSKRIFLKTSTKGSVKSVKGSALAMFEMLAIFEHFYYFYLVFFAACSSIKSIEIVAHLSKNHKLFFYRFKSFVLNERLIDARNEFFNQLESVQKVFA